jgi:hypothetical protein
LIEIKIKSGNWNSVIFDWNQPQYSDWRNSPSNTPTQPPPQRRTHESVPFGTKIDGGVCGKVFWWQLWTTLALLDSP